MAVRVFLVVIFSRGFVGEALESWQVKVLLILISRLRKIRLSVVLG